MRHCMVRIAILAFVMVIFTHSCVTKLSHANETKTVLVAVDLSLSTKLHRNDYIRYFRMILDSMCEGDVLLVTKIIRHPSAHDSLAFNAVRYEESSLLKNRQMVREANFKRSLDALNAFERLMSSIEDETPILEVTKNAERLFAQFSTKRRILVYLSDMLECSPFSFNFEIQKPVFDLKAAQNAFQRTKSEGRIANLQGVRIYVAGARCIEPARYQAVQWFWLAYFGAAQANLDPNRYGPDLIAFDECNSGATCPPLFQREVDKAGNKAGKRGS